MDNAFAIIIDSQAFTGLAEEVYVGIKQKTINLLKEAEIKFKVI